MQAAPKSRVIPAIVAVSLGILTSCSGAEKQTAASVEPLYRAHVFGSRPNQNPITKFELEEWQVPGLWEALQIQIVKPWHLAYENRSPHQPFILSNGQIIPFVQSYGGGILSGVVLGDALYYSYGYGSGIHRSQVGRLRMRNGQPEIHESKSYSMADMLVEKARERVRVVVRDFPHPAETSFLGWIDLTETERLKVIDDAGAEVMLPMSARPLTHEEAMRRRAKLAPYVKTQDVATRRMLEAMGIIIDANNRAYINPAMDDPTKIDVMKVSAAVAAWNLLNVETRQP